MVGRSVVSVPQAMIVNPFSFAHPAEVTSNLQAFVSNGPLTDGDFTAVHRLALVAVWDTVGAMGSSRFVREVYLRGWNKTVPSQPAWRQHRSSPSQGNS